MYPVPEHSRHSSLPSSHTGQDLPIPSMNNASVSPPMPDRKDTPPQNLQKVDPTPEHDLHFVGLGSDHKERLILLIGGTLLLCGGTVCCMLFASEGTNVSSPKAPQRSSQSSSWKN